MNKVIIVGRINSSQDGIVIHPDGISHTHTAGHGNCPKVLIDNRSVKTMGKIRIRKLMPKECYRLMGFDDEDFHKAEAVCSNSQLYKQAGNSIVVDVLEAVFGNLQKAGVL